MHVGSGDVARWRVEAPKRHCCAATAAPRLVTSRRRAGCLLQLAAALATTKDLD